MLILNSYGIFLQQSLKKNPESRCKERVYTDTKPSLFKVLQPVAKSKICVFNFYCMFLCRFRAHTIIAISTVRYVCSAVPYLKSSLKTNYSLPFLVFFFLRSCFPNVDGADVIRCGVPIVLKIYRRIPEAGIFL